MADCSVRGCEKASRTRGWCSAHYERWRRKGEVGPARDLRRRPVRVCSIEDCENRAKGRGWCGKHYWRWQQYGDPTKTVRDYGTYRRTMVSGYIACWAPNHPLATSHGYVLEHRMVAWDLGMLTDPRNHVHHKNHDKQDNRPENLEVMGKAEHHRHHAAIATEFVNQYGVWRRAKEQG